MMIEFLNVMSLNSPQNACDSTKTAWFTKDTQHDMSQKIPPMKFQMARLTPILMRLHINGHRPECVRT